MAKVETEFLIVTTQSNKRFSYKVEGRTAAELVRDMREDIVDHEGNVENLISMEIETIEIG